MKGIKLMSFNTTKLFFLTMIFSLGISYLAAQRKFEYEKRIDLTFNQRLRLGEQHFKRFGKHRGNGYKQFQRWKYWSSRSLDENGMIIGPTEIRKEMDNFKSIEVASSIGGAITEMGPQSATNTSTWSSHLGRLTWIAVEPGNFNHILVSAPTGGVWKTTNNGGTWTPLFDNQPNLDVHTVEISHSNNQHYFAGTDGSGIYRSTDGGTTWTQSTGITAGDWINCIKMHPTNSNILYATGQRFNGNLYRSTDGGASWAVVFNDGVDGLYDIEFKPGDPNTIYIGAVGAIWRSTDGGAMFDFNSASFPGAGVIMLAVTPADATYVYALAETGGGFHALYRSTDSGITWPVRSNNSGMNNNILTYNQANLGGQAPRDQDIEVNPANVDEVHVAGVETWKSTDGGVNWAKSTSWLINDPLPFIHADIDQLTYVSVGATHRLYAATDGGIFYSDDGASNWNDITQGIGTRQFYRIGASRTDVDRVTGGSQDNGAGIIRGGMWYDWLGADGMETFVDWSNANTVYGTTQNGGLSKSTDGGNTRTGLPKPDGENDGSWVTPFEQDPVVANTIYVGFKQLYKSTDGGSTWNAISNFSLTGVGTDTTLMEVKIARSDNNVIYAAYQNRMFSTVDGGTNWTPINLGITFSQINFITIHPTTSNRLIVALSGGANGAKYLESTNGGVNWNDITSNLPNIPANCAIYEGDVDDGIYVGMNPGMYYKNNNSGGNWSDAGNNLPNVSVTEFEIENSTLYIGTFGRGLWKAPLGTGICAVDLVVTDNPAMGNYLALNSITTSGNVVVNAPTVFSSSTIDLTTGFEVPVGNCFEVNNVGCGYNGMLNCDGGGVPDGTCNAPFVITCGQNFNGNSANGNSNWGGYPNDNDYPGPEVIHTIIVPPNSTTTLTMSGLNDDLDLFAGTACDNGSLTITSENGETDDEMVALPNNTGNQMTYFVVVDGWQGATSPYTLSCVNN